MELHSSLLDEFSSDGLFSQFLSEHFDSEAQVSNIIQGTVISEQLSRLNLGLRKIDEEISSQIGSHYEELLSQSNGIESLECIVTSMHLRIQTLQSAVNRIRMRINAPYEELSDQFLMLKRLHASCELLRRVILCLSLSEKLKECLESGPKDITKAASTLKELEVATNGVDLKGIKILDDNQQLIRKAQNDVEKQANSMMEKGMELQNQVQVGAALQVFYNLGTLNMTIDKLLESFVKMVRKSVLGALDISLLTETASNKKRGTAPGQAIMPTIGQSPQFRANLWTALEKLMDDIHLFCQKNYILFKVLAKKRDVSTHKVLLSIVLEYNKTDLFTRLWNPITSLLKREFSRVASERNFIQKALEVDYPKLVRLYGDLWKKVDEISVDMQSFSAENTAPMYDSCTFEDETSEDDKPVLDHESALRQSLVPLEKAFISRSLSRLFDAVNLMFSAHNSAPTKSDIDALIKTMTSELNLSAVDNRLSEAIMKNIVKTIALFCQKCEQTSKTDLDSNQVVGPPTDSQSLNVNLVMQLVYLHKNIEKISSATLSHLQRPILFQLIKTLESITTVINEIVSPIFASLTSSLKSIILTMHDEDFSSDVGDVSDENRCSLFMKELNAFITRSFTDYISPFPQFFVIKDKTNELCCFVFEFFVRNVALLRPIGENGKTKLTNDFAQLESTMETIVPRLSELGSSYRLLRSFRPLLFQTSQHVATSSHLGTTIPHSTVLHFLFSRAPPELKSPHESAGWNQIKYSEWMDEHNEHQRLLLIKGALEAYVLSVKTNRVTEFHSIYPVMIDVLKSGLSNFDVKQ